MNFLTILFYKMESSFKKLEVYLKIIIYNLLLNVIIQLKLIKFNNKYKK